MTTLYDQNEIIRPIKLNQYTHPGDILGDIHPGDLKGTKVTLINLPIREQAKPNNPPMGPALLAARLLAYEVEVNIIDINVYRVFDKDSERQNLPYGRTLTFNEAERLLLDYFNKYGDQDLIGMSGLITTLHWQEKVAKMIRKHQPQAILASGGGLATEFRSILFHWIPELDAIAHSEGDDAILKMAYDAKMIREMGVDSASATGKLDPYFLGIESGRARFIYDGGRPKDLNTLPFPAWDLLISDIHGYPVLENYIQTPVWGMAASNSSATSFEMSRSISMISSRGCPFACKFCFRGAQGERNYGVRSPQNIIEEMVFDVDNYNVDFIGIVDDNFMVQPKRIVDLADAIQPALVEMEIRWGTHGRLDEAADLRPHGKAGRSVNNPVLRVEKMAEAGCKYIGFGAESADAHVLEEMGKGGFILTNGMTKINGYEFPLTMVEGIKKTKAADIHANCTWIMGYPGEDLENLKSTVAFIKWQEEHYTKGLTAGTPEYEIAEQSVNKRLFNASAYPGTELFKSPLVQEKLSKTFGLNFNAITSEAIPDENFKHYVESLDDATKVLVGEGGTLYYGEMDIDKFIEAREYVDSGDLYKILDM